MGEQKKIERTKALNAELAKIEISLSELNAEASELFKRLERVKTLRNEKEERRGAILQELERLNRDI